uniref:Putative terminase n=1 Tax=viral metagenome TaxID=1070528 RepID=A0A6H2A1Y1_9ZZZZ
MNEEKKVAANKIKFFVPTERQEEFIRNKAKIKLFFASNKSGKTCNTVIEDISQCIGYRPYLSPKDPDYFTGSKPPVKVRIYGEDFTQHIGGVIVPALREWIPQSEFEYKDGNPKKNPQGIPTFWKFKNGSTIELLTYEQSSEKSEGWDGHVVHFDEPPPRPTYIAAKRGLIVHGGICLFSLTPLKEPWLYDELWLREDKSVFCIDAKIETNLRHRRKWWRPDGKDGMAWCGKLRQEDIDDFEKDLTPDEKLARLQGKFMHLSGLVYKEFDPNVHIIPWFKVPKNYSFYEAIDQGTRKPWAVTIMAVAPDGTRYIIDEIFVQGVVKDIAEALLEKRKQIGYQPTLATIIDPLAVAEDPISGTTVLNEFMKYGIFCQAGSKDRNRGIQLLKQELIIRETDSKAGIYIFENNRRTIQEFGHYIWDEHSTKQARTSSSIKEVPKKVYDDMLENIHRLLIAGFGYREPQKHKPQDEIIGIGS